MEQSALPEGIPGAVRDHSHSPSPSPFQVKPLIPNLSAMASGNEEEPPEARSSGKEFWAAQGREQLQNFGVFFILSPLARWDFLSPGLLGRLG